MRRPALPSPRLAVRLFRALAIGLVVAACAQVAPPARPAKPPVLTAPPLPGAAGRPSVSEQALPAPPPPPGAVPESNLAPPVAAPGFTPRPGSVNAALLLPLSGPSAAIGTALFNAAQLALFEVGGDNFTLLPFDTKGTTEGAISAAQQALAQHAEIVIGPLFSAETKAAANITRQAGVPMVSFTADRTASGDGVYILGFLPGPQALRVVDYAHSQNKARLAILAPSTEYGRIVVDYLSNNAPALGVSITSLQYYDPAATDFIPPIKRLVKPDPRNPADVGFDALMLPDEGERLKNVAATLSTQGIDSAQVKLLGTMLWEDSKPGNEPSLLGGWYAAPPAAGHTEFDARYAKAFGGRPPRLAALGYDATALAAVLAKRNPHDFSGSVLTNPLGFAGVDGIFRLRPDGAAERGYAIMEVVGDAAAPKEVDPAPAQFQAAY